MKPEIHPNYKQITVTCGCGNTFTTGSVLSKDLLIEVIHHVKIRLNIIFTLKNTMFDR